MRFGTALEVLSLKEKKNDVCEVDFWNILGPEVMLALAGFYKWIFGEANSYFLGHSYQRSWAAPLPLLQVRWTVVDGRLPASTIMSFRVKWETISKVTRKWHDRLTKIWIWGKKSDVSQGLGSFLLLVWECVGKALSTDIMEVPGDLAAQFYRL